MTKLEQAREEYIQAGVDNDQAWDVYIEYAKALDAVRYEDTKKYAELVIEWQRSSKVLDDSAFIWHHSINNLLKLEIEHILATKISISV